MEEAFRLFKSTREYFTPVLTETAFYDKGMLTPEEFVRAGDQLIRNCPSWRWETGEPSKVRPYLPADKQFLSTRGVPSYSRVSVLQASKVVEEVVKGGMGDAEGDWCAPELLKPDEDDADEGENSEDDDESEGGTVVDENEGASNGQLSPFSSPTLDKLRVSPFRHQQNAAVSDESWSSI